MKLFEMRECNNCGLRRVTTTKYHKTNGERCGYFRLTDRVKNAWRIGDKRRRGLSSETPTLIPAPPNELEMSE